MKHVNDEKRSGELDSAIEGGKRMTSSLIWTSSGYILLGKARGDVKVNNIECLGGGIEYYVEWIEVIVHHSCIVDVCKTSNYMESC